MSFLQEIICPNAGVSPHPILLQDDISCTISLLGTSNSESWYFNFIKDVYLLRKAGDPSTTVQMFQTDASLVDPVAYASRSWSLSGVTDNLPLTIAGCSAVNLRLWFEHLSVSTGSAGFRVSFSSSSGKPVYIYISSSTNVLNRISGQNGTIAGFVPRGANPATLIDADLRLGARRKTGVNNGRTLSFVSGVLVDQAETNNDLDWGVFPGLDNTLAANRDWATAPYSASINGGPLSPTIGAISLVDHDYVFYAPFNGGSAYAGSSYAQDVRIFAYTIPDPPQDRWRNYTRSAERIE